MFFFFFFFLFFFFFKQKTAYEIRLSLVGSEMCIRDRCRDVAVGNQVILWGRGLPIDDVADSSETISYELMCGITNRVLRVYNEVGKGE